jgi:uncharacterized protein YbaP (TraB family)
MRARSRPAVPRVVRCLAVIALACASVPVAALDPPSPPTDAALLAPIVVSGEQPGPGLWKVTRDGRVLWILGSLTPLPRDMTWVSREVEATIATSQEVILPVDVDLSVKGGAIGGLFLLPSLLGARNNPDGRTLDEVIPTELYARWSVLKKKYLGRDAGVEKRRPIFAAFELFEAAIKQAGLDNASVVEPVIKRAAKRAKVTVTRPRIELKLDKARATVKAFAQTPLDDLDCLRKTIERLEGDLTILQKRANAWAVGDVEALATLAYVDQNKSCRDALLRSALAEERGMDALPARVMQTWLDAAEQALSTRTSTFATLPIGALTAADGYLDALRARGAEVEAP